MENLGLKILIVEDEFVTISNLKSILSYQGYEVSGIAKSAREALNILENTTIDLAIVDINIKGEHDGIWLANQIKLNFDIPHIFLTAYSDKKTIENAAKTNPYAYLIKPFTKETIFASIQIAIKQYSTNFKQPKTNTNQELAIEKNDTEFSFTKNSFFIKDRGVYQKIYFEEILYASAEMKYIEIYIKTGKRFTFRCNMADFMDTLPSQLFFRSHRSYIVNLKLIDKIGDNFIKVGESKIPLATSRKKELLDLFKI